MTTITRSKTRRSSRDIHCAYCHDNELDHLRACPHCATVLHYDCWLESKGCPTIGCGFRKAPTIETKSPAKNTHEHSHAPDDCALCKRSNSPLGTFIHALGFSYLAYATHDASTFCTVLFSIFAGVLWLSLFASAFNDAD